VSASAEATERLASERDMRVSFDTFRIWGRRGP
jgi:hypothetical protein